MSTINLLYKKQYEINDSISIVIPTVGQIIDDEDSYYDTVTALTAMPIDCMVQLDDAGIDYTAINEYDLFLLMFGEIRRRDTRLIFGDLDLTKFKFAQNEDNGAMVLVNTEDDIVIDRAIHGKIATVLRKIHHLEQNKRKPANAEAKQYMLERARAKLKRNKRRARDSQLETLLIAMVNTEQFKYDFEGARALTIYQFNESVRQIIKKVDYDNRMYGVYSGSLDPKNLSQDDLNWLTHK